MYGQSVRRLNLIYSRTLRSLARVGLFRHGLHCINLWKCSLVSFIGHLAYGADWQGPSKAVIVFTRDGKAHVTHIDSVFTSIVTVKLGLLHRLCNIVMHELDKLVGYIFLIVFDSCLKYREVLFGYPKFVKLLLILVNSPYFSMRCSTT